MRTCSNFGSCSTAELPRALARSQAARRRRVLDATLAARRRGRVRRGADARRRGRGRRRARHRLPLLLVEGAAAARSDGRAAGRPARLPRRAPAAGRHARRPGRQRARRARTGRCASTPTSPRRWCARSAPPQSENADIVRRVSEIMTDVITGAIQARNGDRPTERELRRPHPHAGVALVAHRLGVRRRPARARRRGPRAAADCCCPEPVVPGAQWNVFYFGNDAAPLQLRRPVRARRRQGARPRSRSSTPGGGSPTASSTSARTASRTRCSDAGVEARRPRRHPRDELHRVGRGDVRALQDPRQRR